MFEVYADADGTSCVIHCYFETRAEAEELMGGHDSGWIPSRCCLD